MSICFQLFVGPFTCAKENKTQGSVEGWSHDLAGGGATNSGGGSHPRKSAAFLPGSFVQERSGKTSRPNSNCFHEFFQNKSNAAKSSTKYNNQS